jgi:hypothetical protein
MAYKCSHQELFKKRAQARLLLVTLTLMVCRLDVVLLSDDLE